MNARNIETDYGKIFYYLTGTGKPLVFLHGWGQTSETFSGITPHFEKDFLVMRVDLPGFGRSSEPLRALRLADYVAGVQKIFQKENLKSPAVVAHSFGGRVAICLSEKHPLSALILVSSAGIRRKSIKLFIRIYAYKLKKFFYRIFSYAKYKRLTERSGSRDYRNASPVMKGTLSKIISEDLRRKLKKIKTKAYLLWGIHDRETPFRDGILMASLLENSVLIPFYESGHFCYLEEEKKFIRELKKILLEEDLWKHSET
ncbi:MAG: alpha/beta hydrolase [Bacilli bacterium]